MCKIPKITEFIFEGVFLVELISLHIQRHLRNESNAKRSHL